MDGRLILYVGEKNISSWSMRGFLALAFKDLPFEERTISLRQDRDRRKRREVSPTGRVPVLHHEMGSGDVRVVPDSLAIMEYLEETFPPPRHPALWPSEPGRRAHARWLAATMHSGFTKLRESMSFNLCFLPTPPAATPEALDEARDVLRLWEETLGGGSAGPYLLGDLGGVDLMFAPVAWRLTAFRVPAETTPRAAAYMKTLLEQPLVRRWMDPARALPAVSNY